jgi:DNA repair exonuclease SbcCD ATPase subunit
MKMDLELPNESEELIKFLSDRIEEIEHTLADDEDFCNKDIDATYQAALNYFQSFQRKFDEKLNELKAKLEKIREENSKTSKQNQKQFDDEIEEINQLFSSGKHQEGWNEFFSILNIFIIFQLSNNFMIMKNVFNNEQLSFKIYRNYI